MALITASFLLLLGLAVLVKGADWLVDGSVAIARHLGVNTLIIGLTIVAMGTSAPEVAASIMAALADSGDIAVGNVYGSNIANLALIGGICAIIRPITIARSVLVRDIPIMLASTLLLYLFLQDLSLSRIDGGLIIVLFLGILLFIIKSEKQAQDQSELAKEVREVVSYVKPLKPLKPLKAVLFVAIGLLCLATGARIAVGNAVILGKAAGISEAVIGLSIIAIGTSLPELITCLIASFKGHDDLSVGNLVGSNIFNACFVIGSSGLVMPFRISDRLIGLDFWLVLFMTLIFSFFAYTSRRISRPAGIFLAACYSFYLIYLVATNR